MDTRYIVALEIGSSKIKGIIAAVGELGDINVIDIEEDKVNDCVRHGRIQNVQEVSVHANNIIRKLENLPAIAPRKITDIFVSLGGRSLSTIITQSKATYPTAITISNETIDRLKREASFELVTNKDNPEMLPHTFFVDNAEVKNVVGTVGSNIRAQFTAIVLSPVVRRNLDLIDYDGRNIKSHYVVRPTALANLVLTPSEKQLGCALVDFGAETTTVSIYKSDVLQAIITLPMGSRNITRDLMNGLSITEDNAELAKARSGSATPLEGSSSSDAEIINYISARAGEIVANILNQIELAGFKQALPKGIILTGGGAALRNFDSLVAAQAKMPVRLAAIDSSTLFKGNITNRNSNLDVLALVKHAAEQTTVDCLTPAPAKNIEPTHSVHNDGYEQPRPGRRPDFDEANIYDDDDDYVPHTPNNGARPVVSSKGKNSKGLDDSYDDDDQYQTDGPTTKTAIEKVKDALSRFWTKAVDENEDIDEMTN